MAIHCFVVLLCQKYYKPIYPYYWLGDVMARMIYRTTIELGNEATQKLELIKHHVKKFRLNGFIEQQLLEYQLVEVEHNGKP
jgi:hypothetical protein